MNVSTITMDRDAAREKFDEYRRSGKLQAEPEYQAALAAYEALAKGTPLLVLSDVIAAAPRDEKGRPRLAIARADQPQVKYTRTRHQAFERFSIEFGRRWGRRFRDGTIDVPTTGVTPDFPAPADRERPWSDSTTDGFALIPMVPPDVRGRRDLSKYFILWEVERWSDTVLRAGPDIDPYLLTKIGEDLFAVVGEWDLTDVERAVMRDRRTL